MVTFFRFVLPETLFLPHWCGRLLALETDLENKITSEGYMLQQASTTWSMFDSRQPHKKKLHDSKQMLHVPKFSRIYEPPIASLHSCK